MPDTNFVELTPPPLSPANTKEENWKIMESYIDMIGDKLGMGVDTGIKETVIALNVLGINTSQSCEGHLERGLAAPWVHIQAIETAEMVNLKQKVQDQIKRADEAESEGASSEVLDQIYSEYHKLNNQSKRPHLEQLKKAMAYLTEFYKDRQVPYDRLLIIDVFGYGGRIQPQGCEFQEIENSATQKQKLREYQSEMEAFSKFLKNKYFEL